jgi:hypothetical protein
MNAGRAQCIFIFVLLTASSFTACGGDNPGTATQPTPSYTISGVVSGLSGAGLVLQNNSGDNLSIGANGNFAFGTTITSGSTYNVTVLVQPSAPSQTCAVTNGRGTASATVTNVQVTCTTIAYTIGGTVSGLSGTGLVLQNNGGDNLIITANDSFDFTTPVDIGGTYNVTVLTQPSSPAQDCVVTNGNGTANANVINISLTCLSEWVWVNGSKAGNQPGTYGTEGMAAPGNVPGGRQSEVSWIDSSGNFWLFGGIGLDAIGESGPLNDLWEFNAGQWTWVNGSNFVNQHGTYGTIGIGSSSNVPGARSSAVSWTDASGNFWLFGGYGYDSAGTQGYLNDLWEYGGGEWTWMGGSNLANPDAVYGTQGVADPGNSPGGCAQAVGWLDAAGNFWLFGGSSQNSLGLLGSINELWRYGAGEWTWVGGSNLGGQSGTYGTQGTAAPSNIPGARVNPASWIDASGTLWLFGGEGYDSAGTFDFLNDLWKYSAGEWTWVSGSNVAKQQGIYGVKGTAAPGNLPGARSGGTGWIDSSGNLWLFGGSGPNAVGTGSSLNDLWRYSAGEWTWMAGSNVLNQQGTYGTIGVPAPDNVPGGRVVMVTWIDAAGNLWLFGGEGFDYSGRGVGPLNDLWEFGLR